MKLHFYFILLTFAFGLQTVFAQNEQTSASQTPEPEKLSRYEIGAQFTSLSNSPRSIGFGGRFTFNLNRNVAFEAEGNALSGPAGQGLFGVKAGRRYNKFGIFAKARPGFIYDSRGSFEYVLRSTPNPAAQFPFDVRRKSQTSFALDVGGVLEFYPTKHLVTRFDFGDTIIVTPPRTINFPIINGNEAPVLQSFRLSTRTTNNFQFSAGVGYRF